MDSPGKPLNHRADTNPRLLALVIALCLRFFLPFLRLSLSLALFLLLYRSDELFSVTLGDPGRGRTEAGGGAAERNSGGIAEWPTGKLQDEFHLDRC